MSEKLHECNVHESFLALVATLVVLLQGCMGNEKPVTLGTNVIPSRNWSAVLLLLWLTLKHKG